MSEEQLQPRRTRGARIILAIALGLMALVVLYAVVAVLLVASGVWGGA